MSGFHSSARFHTLANGNNNDGDRLDDQSFSLEDNASNPSRRPLIHNDSSFYGQAQPQPQPSQRGQRRPSSNVARRVNSSRESLSAGSSSRFGFNESQSISYTSYGGGTDFGGPGSGGGPASPPSARRPSVFTTTSGSRYYHDGGDGPPIPIRGDGIGPISSFRVNDDHNGGRFSPLASPPRGHLVEPQVQRGGGGVSRAMEHISEVGVPPFAEEQPPFSQEQAHISRGSPQHNQQQQHGGGGPPPRHQFDRPQFSSAPDHPSFRHPSEFGRGEPIMEDLPYHQHQQQQQHQTPQYPSHHQLHQQMQHAHNMQHPQHHHPQQQQHHHPQQALSHSHQYPPPPQLRNATSFGVVVPPPAPPPPSHLPNVDPLVDVTAPSRSCLDRPAATDCYNLERGIAAGSDVVQATNHVICQQCQARLVVSKQAIMVQCPDCEAVNPATNINSLTTVGNLSSSTASASLKDAVL